ncbi:response regulator transcription factor [Dehalogenimonas etheniformans]|uniref:DNA-binding response regulator n=1 Tax=Dehalogenimonas etheniformans TaxID=1536648 RepID=A0A2P5P916_9CHLR|nr:response regulator transcription factor [Dehalogenimonas etheniformans]PPD58789.1 DNA-binding response regulator [Dehalogenimonas etheniformans]
MVNKPELTVVLIEDDAEIIEAITLTFKIRWPQATFLSTDSGQEGLTLIEKHNPDLVILDLGLPDTNGYNVLKEIRRFSHVPVIILTARGDETDIVRGLELGADEYIIKPFRQMELLARVKAVLRRQEAVSEELPLAVGTMTLGPSIRDLTLKGKKINLTRTEGIVLGQLMRHVGHPVSHAVLAKALWGEEYPGAAESLKVYVRHLREKIEENPSDPKLLLTRIGAGYQLAKPE